MKSLALGQEAIHDVLVLRRARSCRSSTRACRRAAARPPRRAGSRPAASRQPRRQGGRLAPARVGPRRERAEVRARRVDEHAVVGRGLLRPRRRRPVRTSTSAPPCARPYARAPPRARHGARPPRRRRGPPSARPGASSCRRAPRTGRARARRAAGASTRATAIAARDCGMNAPCSHSGEPNASKAPSSTSPSGRPSAGLARDGQLRRELGAVRPQRVGAQRRLGRAVAGGHQRARGLGPERLEPQLGDPARVGVAQRRPRRPCRRAAPPTSARASRAARRSTAFTRPAPRGASRLGQLDRLRRRPRAAATPSRNASWKTPSRSAASTAGSSSGDRALRQRARSRGRASPRAGRRRTRAGSRARGRARRARRARPPRAAPGPPRPPARRPAARPRTRPRERAHGVAVPVPVMGSSPAGEALGGRLGWRPAGEIVQASGRSGFRSFALLQKVRFLGGSNLRPNPDNFPKGSNHLLAKLPSRPLQGDSDMTDRNTKSGNHHRPRPPSSPATIAAGLCAGVLGVGAIAVPLVGWNDWPQALSSSSGDPITMSTATGGGATGSGGAKRALHPAHHDLRPDGRHRARHRLRRARLGHGRLERRHGHLRHGRRRHHAPAAPSSAPAPPSPARAAARRPPASSARTASPTPPSTATATTSPTTTSAPRASRSASTTPRATPTATASPTSWSSACAPPRTPRTPTATASRTAPRTRTATASRTRSRSRSARTPTPPTPTTTASATATSTPTATASPTRPRSSPAPTRA